MKVRKISMICIALLLLVSAIAFADSGGPDVLTAEAWSWDPMNVNNFTGHMDLASYAQGYCRGRTKHRNGRSEYARIFRRERKTDQNDYAERFLCVYPGTGECRVYLFRYCQNARKDSVEEGQADRDGAEGQRRTEECVHRS